MPYTVEFGPEALNHLRSLRAYDRAIVLAAIAQQLPHEANVETRHRKPLGTNPLSQWELAVGDFRVFYDVIESESNVRVVAIGWKEHNRLFVGGLEYTL
jgi:mRNA-degrading endonuclease RelE of RelBE toxin-antitoxin system